LLNTPSISAISNFRDNLSKIELGDCFFCDDIAQISKGLNKGAYCIVSSKIDNANINKLSLLDEIAYLKVDSLKQAKLRLLRFFLNKYNNKINFYTTSKDYAKMFKCFKRYKNSFLLKNNIKKDFVVLLKIFEKLEINKCDTDTIKPFILCDDLKYAKLLHPNIINYKIKNHIDMSNIYGTFYSSFVVNNILYKQLNICPFYVNMFLDINFKLLKTKTNIYNKNSLFDSLSNDENKNLALKTIKEVSNLDNFKQLKCIYLDSCFNITNNPNNVSNKILITSNTKCTYKKEILFLKKKFKPSNVTAINFVKHLKINKNNTIKTKYKNKDILLNDIKKQFLNYNVLYVKNISYKKMCKILEKNTRTHTASLF
jgi:hypothetical protein